MHHPTPPDSRFVEDDDANESRQIQTPRATSTFATLLFGISLWLLGLGLFFHFWPTSLVLALFIGFIWISFKNPFILLGILLGIELSS